MSANPRPGGKGDLERRLKKAEERLAAGDSERDGDWPAYRAQLTALAAALGFTLDGDGDDAQPPLRTPADARAHFFACLAARARRPPHEATDDPADDAVRPTDRSEPI